MKLYNLKLNVFIFLYVCDIGDIVKYLIILRLIFYVKEINLFDIDWVDWMLVCLFFVYLMYIFVYFDCV